MTTARAAALVVAAGLCGALTLGLADVAAAAVATGGALAVRRLRRRRGDGVGDRHAVDLALCLDLLGAVLACGALPSAALGAVARVCPGPVGEALATASTALKLGADAGGVWATVATAVPALSPAARVCARAAGSGAGVSEELFRLAAASRVERQASQRQRMQRAGVWLVLPLGLCFLPAFVLVAVVPVVLAAMPALSG